MSIRKRFYQLLIAGIILITLNQCTYQKLVSTKLTTTSNTSTNEVVYYTPYKRLKIDYAYVISTTSTYRKTITEIKELVAKDKWETKEIDVKPYEEVSDSRKHAVSLLDTFTITEVYSPNLSDGYILQLEKKHPKRRLGDVTFKATLDSETQYFSAINTTYTNPAPAIIEGVFSSINGLAQLGTQIANTVIKGGANAPWEANVESNKHFITQPKANNQRESRTITQTFDSIVVNRKIQKMSSIIDFTKNEVSIPVTCLSGYASKLGGIKFPELKFKIECLKSFKNACDLTNTESNSATLSKGIVYKIASRYAVSLLVTDSNLGVNDAEVWSGIIALPQYGVDAINSYEIKRGGKFDQSFTFSKDGALLTTEMVVKDGSSDALKAVGTGLGQVASTVDTLSKIIENYKDRERTLLKEEREYLEKKEKDAIAAEYEKKLKDLEIKEKELEIKIKEKELEKKDEETEP